MDDFFRYAHAAHRRAQEDGEESESSMSKPMVERFQDGYAILGDSTSVEVRTDVRRLVGPVALIVADPPYGNIVDETWDRIASDDDQFAQWMVAWTRAWTDDALLAGGAFYVWGGVGRPGFRPFLRYLHEVERKGTFELANLITWKKKRAYGVPKNYLWTREELAYFVNGDAKKPRTFNIPLLEEKRGYPGYDAKHPAKSEYLRRTNVWTDVTEILKGKLHPTQKPQRVIEVPIEVHTRPGECVIDLFAGAGTTAFAARKLGRRFAVIEKEKDIFEQMVRRLRRTCVPAADCMIAAGDCRPGHVGRDGAAKGSRPKEAAHG